MDALHTVFDNLGSRRAIVEGKVRVGPVMCDGNRLQCEDILDEVFVIG